jgi:uracil-DNA glycosylase
MEQAKSRPSEAASQKAATFIDYWKMMGVDYLVEDAPVSWLVEHEIAAETRPEMPQHQSAEEQAPNARPVHTPAAPPKPTAAAAEWPASLEDLLSAIAAGAPLPGNQYGGGCAAPAGIENPAIMIISDLPDIDEVDAGRLGAGAAGRLLANMVRAMGHDITGCYLTALATTRPASGDLPDNAAQNLVPFMMHQIQLMKPASVLILGSAACSALLGAELMTARGSLHYFNHNVQKVSAVTTFHPRTLMARPILKAQAWNDLLMLMRKDVS